MTCGGSVYEFILDFYMCIMEICDHDMGVLLVLMGIIIRNQRKRQEEDYGISDWSGAAGRLRAGGVG